MLPLSWWMSAVGYRVGVNALIERRLFYDNELPALFFTSTNAEYHGNPNLRASSRHADKLVVEKHHFCKGEFGKHGGKFHWHAVGWTEAGRT